MIRKKRKIKRAKVIRISKSHDSSRGYTSLIKSGQKCHICGRAENHVVSVNKNGKSQIEYFACKHFVELSPFDRRKTLYEKGFCGKCLRPGMTRDPEHDCDQKFL